MGGGSVDHVVPKRKIAVLVRLQNGDTVAGHAFLDYIDVIHRGDQTLLDKLNDDFPWFPVTGDDDGVEILNRRHVVLVQPGPDVPPDLVRPDLEENAAHYRSESVMLRLDGDLTLEGRIPMDLPEEFSRLSDFLNFPEDFFVVETDDGPVLVSKSHVTSLVPHETPPVLPSDTGRGGEERA
jgi:hypothetical protein